MAQTTSGPRKPSTAAATLAVRTRKAQRLAVELAERLHLVPDDILEALLDVVAGELEFRRQGPEQV